MGIKTSFFVEIQVINHIHGAVTVELCNGTRTTIEPAVFCLRIICTSISHPQKVSNYFTDCGCTVECKTELTQAL